MMPLLTEEKEEATRGDFTIMASFCVKCGSPLTTGPFCTKCGTRGTSQSVPASGAIPEQPVPTISPVQSSARPVNPGPAPAQPASAKPGMSSFAKFGIAAVVIIFVGGAAAAAVGFYYVAHRVSQKVHETKDRILGSNSVSGADVSAPDAADSAGTRPADSGNDNSMGNVCRLLSKQDVSKAVGVEIVRTESKDNGCSYMAKGSQQDMTAKHLKAMVADKGADKKTQQIAEKFAGGMMTMFQTEKRASELNTPGEVPVFVFSLDQHNAEAQMRLNAKVLGNLGNQVGLPGIGDQAFVSADGMILVRKGKTLVRIMYLACPCGIEQVKPLAKEIADAL